MEKTLGVVLIVLPHVPLPEPMTRFFWDSHSWGFWRECPLKCGASLRLQSLQFPHPHVRPQPAASNSSKKKKNHLNAPTSLGSHDFGFN